MREGAEVETRISDKELKSYSTEANKLRKQIRQLALNKGLIVAVKKQPYGQHKYQWTGYYEVPSNVAEAIRGREKPFRGSIRADSIKEMHARRDLTIVLDTTGDTNLTFTMPLDDIGFNSFKTEEPNWHSDWSDVTRRGTKQRAFNFYDDDRPSREYHLGTPNGKDWPEIRIQAWKVITALRAVPDTFKPKGKLATLFNK
ncbi:hypothetical protein HYS90_00170 [Candidatus Curtissbacteria bacterium]|nr:hypothetical protein [Candidatus Curtissbacteria bacterium]